MAGRQPVAGQRRGRTGMPASSGLLGDRVALEGGLYSDRPERHKTPLETKPRHASLGLHKMPEARQYAEGPSTQDVQRRRPSFLQAPDTRPGRGRASNPSVRAPAKGPPYTRSSRGSSLSGLTLPGQHKWSYLHRETAPGRRLPEQRPAPIGRGTMADRFKDAAPALFRTSFVQSAKDHVDSVRLHLLHIIQNSWHPLRGLSHSRIIHLTSVQWKVVCYWGCLKPPSPVT